MIDWEADMRAALAALAGLPPAPVRIWLHPLLWTALRESERLQCPDAWAGFEAIARVCALPVEVDDTLDPAFMRVRWSNGRETMERATRDGWPGFPSGSRQSPDRSTVEEP